jgi:dipeptidyl aminopeptidase/acylaminoacyl peptidase
MKMSKTLVLLTLSVFLFSILSLVSKNKQTHNPSKISSPSEPTPISTTHPLSIESLRNREYSASEIIIEQTLNPGVNYNRYIASYKSDDLKIYGLLTIPHSLKPTNGFPTIVFLHGYINPKQYITTQDYVASQDGLAQNNFITFKPDLRGHGQSEGTADGAHFSPSYVIDTLNAISALKTYSQTDPTKIGVWGHSNGGEIALRAMVISKDIKASVLWAGVVGSFQDMLETYNHKIPFMKRSTPDLIIQYGIPSVNPDFWELIEPYNYLSNISAPTQLHHGTADEQVPIELSQSLASALKESGKFVELYEYHNANHNFTGNSFGLALQRSVTFFKKNL